MACRRTALLPGPCRVAPSGPSERSVISEQKTDEQTINTEKTIGLRAKQEKRRRETRQTEVNLEIRISD